MNFTSDKFTFKAYGFTTKSSPIKLHDVTIKLEKQPDGSYGVPSNSVLVKVHAAALNPIDIKIINLAYWPIGKLVGQQGVGKDFSGKIVSIGRNAQSSTGLKPGDLVQGLYQKSVPNGTLSEYLLVDTTDKTVGGLGRIPKNLSLTDAASWPVVFSTVNNLTTGLEFKDKKILVLGGGTSVGRYLIQYLKLENAQSIFATASPRSQAIVKELGATGTIDYTKGSILNPILELVKANGPFDFIFDCAGSNELFPKIKHILPKSGHYASIVGDVSFQTLSVSNFFATLKSFTRAYYSQKHWLPYTYVLSVLTLSPGWLEKGTKLIEEGKLKPFIDSYYKFSQLNEALEKLKGTSISGKIIVQVEED